jgi:hypothetical protein
MLKFMFCMGIIAITYFCARGFLATAVASGYYQEATPKP